MATKVSIPEKTLEHWASMDITARYGQGAKLWWPAAGEDIAVDWLPLRGAGKAFHLETKTAHPKGPRGRRHEVTIRLLQLEKYVRGPVPVYYVLPTPPWRKSLSRCGAVGLALPPGFDPSDMAFYGNPLWFGEWSFVISADVLYRLLKPQIVALRSLGLLTKRTEVPILDYDEKKAAINFSLVDGKSLALADLITWPDFWDRMERCGSADLPALFLTSWPLHESPRHADLRAALTAASRFPDAPNTLYAPESRYSPDEPRQNSPSENSAGDGGRQDRGDRYVQVDRNAPSFPTADKAAFIISVFLTRPTLRLL